MTELEFRVLELRHQLKEANHAYYTSDDPILTDSQYDELMRELKMIETEHPEFAEDTSPTNIIGGNTSEYLSTYIHDTQMYSLDNIYTERELMQYETYLNRKGINANEIEWYCDVKLDGMSLACTYEDEQFVRAVTRGNGTAGENITATAQRCIMNLPVQFSQNSLLDIFPKYLQVRGECVISIPEFFSRNQDLVSIGEKPKANSRNMVAGLLRRLPTNFEDLNHCVKYYVYGTADIGYHNPHNWFTHADMMNNLKNMGFDIVPYAKVVTGLNAVYNYYLEIHDLRSTLPVAIDGIVFRTNDLSLHDILGTTNRAPRYAMAYKFPAQRGTSKIKNISLNVGRTGVITPVANLDPPISCNGVIITKATLYNEKYIHDQDIRINDTVVVERSGDVIPKIIKVEKEYRDNKSSVYPRIQNCPCCNQPTTFNEVDAFTYCTNPYCTDKLNTQFAYIVGKTCLDIIGIGKSMINDLRSKGYLNHVLDIFTITEKELLEIGISKKRAVRIANAINHKRQHIPLDTFICLLNIPHVGRGTAKEIATHILQVNDFLTTSFNTLTAIPTIGEITAELIDTYLKNNQDLKTKLAVYKITVVPMKPIIYEKHCALSGKRVLFTGTFNIINKSRRELYALATKYGIIMETAFSKLDCIIVGSNPSPGKIEKAQKMNINIVSEQEFYDIIYH